MVFLKRLSDVFDDEVARLIETYGEKKTALASLYQCVRTNYGPGTTFYGEVARKTEKLIRERARIGGVEPPGDVVAIDEAFMARMGQDGLSDTNKVVNLVRILEQEAKQKGNEEPYLIPMAERARTILDQYDGSQDATANALVALAELDKERRQAQEEREQLGLDGNTYAIFTELRRRGFATRSHLAEDLNGAFERFSHYQDNPEEMRQLKAELYKLILSVVDGKQMVEIADALLALQRYEPPS